MVQRAQAVMRLERVAQPLVQVEHLVLAAQAAASENKFLKKEHHLFRWCFIFKNMCYRKTCSVCGKPTYGGCGKHIEQVLGDVPPEQRCKGHSVEEDDDLDD